MQQTKITILLVDDHAIVREGYRSLLSKQPGLNIIAEAADGFQAYQQYQKHQPDVTILDISMQGMSGLEVISRIKQRNADAKILVFSMHQNPLFALQATRAGALGYVTKSSPPAEFLRAISQVHAGHAVLSADIAQALALEKIGNERMALDSLTPREFEILQLLLAEKTAEEIARTLSISAKTVCNCHYLIKRKLGVSSDIELTRMAIRLALI
jgi:DNA-binding NarL/FixJ family response regulator